MFKKWLFAFFPLACFSSPSGAATSGDMDCFFNWAEKSYAQFLAPAQAASQTAGPYYFRLYSATGTALGLDNGSQHVVFLSGGALQDLGDAAPLLAYAGCGAAAGQTNYAGTWTYSMGAYYSVQFILTQTGTELTALIPSTGQHFIGKIDGTSAVFTEDDGKAAAQATVTPVSANAADLRMDSCSSAQPMMCLIQAGAVIRLTR